MHLPPRDSAELGDFEVLAAGSVSAAMPTLWLEQHGTFKAGARVEMHSLKSAEHLNGRTAHVLGFDKLSGRLAVELELAHRCIIMLLG